MSFATMLLAEKLWLVIASQIFMGPAVGFLYYSSLFYSMDVGETKGEHGGFHESALGLGIFLGPVIGAAAMVLLNTFITSYIQYWGLFFGITLIFIVLFFTKGIGGMIFERYEAQARRRKV